MNAQRRKRWAFLAACVSLLVIGCGVCLRLNSTVPIRIRVLLMSRDWDVRRGAATELAKLRNHQAARLLIGLLHDNNTWVRSEADKALSNVWEATPPDVLMLWLKEHPTVAAPAAERLGLKGLTGAVEALSAALARRPSPWEDSNEYSELRSAAARALGAIGDERAVDALMAAAAHPIHMSDQANAVEALRVFKSPRSFDLLLEIVLSLPVRDPAMEEMAGILGEGILQWARQSAIVALVELNDARAVEPLIGVLKDPQAEVCGTAAWALGRFRDARAVPKLEALAGDSKVDPTSRQCAAHSLLEIKDGDAAGQIPPPEWYYE